MKTHKTMLVLRVVAALAVVIAGGKLAQAQGCNVEWTGNAGTDVWGTAGNWSTHHVPGPTSNVCILKAPSTGSVDATTSPSISVDSIQVGPGVGLAFGSGTVSITTSLTSQGYLTLFGTTLIAPSVNMEAGSLVGGGTIDGTLTNSGYLHPTNAETLTVTNYTQTANGELSVQWGTTALVVKSNATLTGSLVVGINPKRPPAKGSTYTAVTFGSRSGEFTSVTVEDGGTVEYTADSVLVTFE